MEQFNIIPSALIYNALLKHACFAANYREAAKLVEKMYINNITPDIDVSLIFTYVQ